MSIKEGLDKLGKDDCHGNQHNTVITDKIGTSVIADIRESTMMANYDCKN